MNVSFQTGDVLARYIGRDGVRRYVRVGATDPTVIAAGRVYVQDCDSAGFLLGSKGRYLLATSLASRYRFHSSPDRTRYSA